MAKYKRNPSIIQYDKESYISDAQNGIIDPHEPIGGKNKRLSEEDGLWLWVTREEHRWIHDTEEGQELNKQFQEISQRRWMEHNNKTVEEFIKRYGRNYL